MKSSSVTIYTTDVYPNPAAGKKVYVRFEEDAAFADIYLYNIIGKIILQQKVQPVSKENKIVLNLPELNPGPYFIRLRFNNIEKLVKLIIE